MIDILFAMEETALQSFVNFKSDLDKQRALATPDQIDKVTASVQKLQSRTGQFFTFDEETGIVTIPISGTLTPKPEICVSLHDGSQTLYPTIVDATKQAQNLASVKKVRYIYATPGGYVSGVEDAALAIRDCKIETEAVVTDMAASAGYWLASQSNNIIAKSPLASVGSIGVLVEVIDRSDRDKENGIKRFVLTSKNAPEKFPDVGTKSGRDKIITRLTDIEKVFISRVAEGRGVSADTVKSDFGRGAVFTAEDALAVGMIDRIENGFKSNIDDKTGKNKVAANISTQNSTPATPGEINKPPKEKTMETLQEFLDKNPGAKVDLDKITSKAVEVAVSKINARIESAKNFLANENYPTLSEMALKVIVGEVDSVALTSSVAAIDAMKQGTESGAAADEGEEQPETPAAEESQNQKDEAEMQAKKKRLGV